MKMVPAITKDEAIMLLSLADWCEEQENLNRRYRHHDLAKEKERSAELLRRLAEDLRELG